MPEKESDRISRIFDEALRQAPHTRAAYLARVCADDAQLRAVRSLLEHHQKAASDFMQAREIDPDATLSRPSGVAGSRGRQETADAVAQPPLVPDYELCRSIGRGGFGEVWLGRSKLSRKYCAIKIIHSHRGVELEGVRQYQQRVEDHPNLVSILHVGETEGFCYYVMPLADNATGSPPLIDQEVYQPLTLQTHLRRRDHLEIDEAVHIVDEVLTALEHLHEKGAIHGDVKPANIFRIRDRWCLGDVGLVTSTERSGPEGHTRGYTPPEGPGGRTGDLYALGVTLFELVTGASPQRLPDFRAGTLATPAIDLQNARLGTYILRATDTDPKARFRAACHMRSALAAMPHSSSYLPEATVPRGDLVTRHPRRWILAGSVAFAVVALTLGMLFPSIVWPFGPRGDAEEESDRETAQPSDGTTSHLVPPPPPSLAEVEIEDTWATRDFERPARPGAKDVLTIYVKADQQGSFYLFRVGPDGRTSIWPPNYRTGSNRCKPNRYENANSLLRIDRYALVDDQPGAYCLIAVLTSEQRNDICEQFEEGLIFKRGFAFDNERDWRDFRGGEKEKIRVKIREVIDASEDENSILGFGIFPYPRFSD